MNQSSSYCLEVLYETCNTFMQKVLHKHYELARELNSIIFHKIQQSFL